jgi:hypothetical protein
LGPHACHTGADLKVVAKPLLSFLLLLDSTVLHIYVAVFFNLGYETTTYINQNETGTA